MSRLLGKALAGFGQGISESAAVMLNMKWQQTLQQYQGWLKKMKLDRQDVREAMKQAQANARAKYTADKSFEASKYRADRAYEAALLKARGGSGDSLKEAKGLLDFLDKYGVDKQRITIRDENGNHIGALTQLQTPRGPVLLGDDFLLERYFQQLLESTDQFDSEQVKAMTLAMMYYNDTKRAWLGNLLQQQPEAADQPWLLSAFPSMEEVDNKWRPRLQELGLTPTDAYKKAASISAMTIGDTKLPDLEEVARKGKETAKKYGLPDLGKPLIPGDPLQQGKELVKQEITQFGKTFKKNLGGLLDYGRD